MYATRSIRNAAMALLAADTNTLAPAADAIYIALVKNQIAPSEGIVLADCDLADFDGSNPLAVGLNAQPEGYDPTTDDSIIDLKPPAGGFRWITTGVTNLPQTIYGFVLLNHAQDTVLASELLAVAQPLSLLGQRIDLGDVLLRLPANSMS